MNPPKIARFLLVRLAPPRIRDTLADDLGEAFRMEVHRRGENAARIWYWRQTITGIPSLIRMHLGRARRPTKQDFSPMTRIDALTRDVRYAVRLFIRSPGFTLAAVVTLALGIGANTMIFSVIKVVLLQPLPFGAPERLVMVWDTANPGPVTHLSLAEIVSYGSESESLAQLSGYTETNVNLTGTDDPERVRSAFVTADLFETLQVEAMLGRTFAAAEGRPGGERVVILGHGLWQRRFAGAADVIGRSIAVNGRPRTVIGVMPPSFRLPLDYRVERPTELWVPLQLDRDKPGAWGDRSYFAVGRLRPGVEATTATAQFAAIADGWIRAGFVADPGEGLRRSAIPLQDFLAGPVRRTLLTLLGAVGCVLLIACANVMNLLLARADVRRREVAVRAAVGASRSQLGQQVLIESAVLSGIGSGLGVALAYGGLYIIAAIRPPSVPQVAQAVIDETVLLFTLAVAVVAGLLFGLGPALRLSHPDLREVLNESGHGHTSTRAKQAKRRALVVAQLACSVVLVIAAGLLLRSLVQLYRIDLGFNPANVLTAQIQLPVASYPDSGRVVAFYREVTQRLEQLPGVSAAGAVRVLPLARNIGNWSITIEGRPYIREENPNGDFQWVTPGYFRAMGTTLLRGRLLTDRDREDAPLVVVINETMAERYWPSEGALGKRFHMGGVDAKTPKLTIVGIVRTARHNAVSEAPRAEMYLPHAQLSESIGGAAGWPMALVVKTTGDPMVVAAPLRGIVRSMDRNLPVSELRTMEQITANALAAPRFAALLLGMFAALALVLAAIGVYGTISLLVTERTKEIGIRIALGAGRDSIRALILREGLTLASAGAALGTAGAVLVTRLLSTLVYGVDTLDPATFIAAPTLLVVVALFACFVPVLRAESVNPVITLRAN